MALSALACGSTDKGDHGAGGTTSPNGSTLTGSNGSSLGGAQGSTGTQGSSTNTGSSSGSGGQGGAGGTSTSGGQAATTSEASTTESTGGSAGGGGVLLEECDVPEPCPVASSRAGELNLPPSEESIRCILQAFRDRTPGRYTRSVDLGAGAIETHYVIDDEGTIVSQNAAGGVISACAPRSDAEYDECLVSGGTGTDFVDACGDFAWVSECSQVSYQCPL